MLENVLIFLVLSLSQYASYDIRARTVEGLVLASAYKSIVTDYYVYHEQWPTGTPEEISQKLGLRDFQPTQNTQNIWLIEDGVVVIEYTDRVGAGKRIELVPHVDLTQGLIRWECRNGAEEHAFSNQKQLPAECRN